MMPTRLKVLAVRGVLFVALGWGLATVALFAANTGQVVFKNGQKLVGEIKGLDRGMLSFKTDETGTISIKWNRVAGLSSSARFRVETATGLVLVGSFEASSQEGLAVIAADTGPIRLALDQIVMISPFEKKMLDRFKGYLNIGFSLQRAQSLTTLALGASVSYRASKMGLNLAANSYIGKQESVPTTTRNDVSASFQRDLKRRWLAIAMTAFQQNSELGLRRRVALGGGFGNKLIMTNHMVLTAGAGVVGVDERYADTAESTQNAEGLITGTLSMFRYTYPKLDFTVGAKVFPSLTDWGRVRIELNTNLSYELIRDFFISLDGFYSFDSRPPAEATTKRDYGLTTSIRWEFHQ